MMLGKSHGEDASANDTRASGLIGAIDGVRWLRSAAIAKWTVVTRASVDDAAAGVSTITIRRGMYDFLRTAGR